MASKKAKRKAPFIGADPAMSTGAGESVIRAASPKPEDDRVLWCFGIYKAVDGNWILRNVKCDGTKVLEIHDSEPDLLAIQMGKIESELDRQAERQVNGTPEAGR